LPVSFGTPKNPCIEYITFDVVDMLYPYNAIFEWGLLNTFKDALHSGYLYLKVPAIFGIITIFGSQKKARNTKRGFAPGHKNMHFARKTQSIMSMYNLQPRRRLRQNSKKQWRP
jgi:hypothetical protein